MMFGIGRTRSKAKTLR